MECVLCAKYAHVISIPSKRSNPFMNGFYPNIHSYSTREMNCICKEKGVFCLLFYM